MQNDLIQFLLTHGYVIMFFLMWLEGPIVTLAAAFLASLGFFSLPVVFIISLVGDITGDIVLYAIGRKWGIHFVNRFGKYIGITQRLVDKMQGHFHVHGGKTIFMVKSTTGLCFVTFVAAGIARMPLKRFVRYSLYGGVVWSSVLVGMGYFFGALYTQIATYISWAGWFILIGAIIVLVAMTLYKKYEAQKYFHDTDHAV